MANWSRSLKWAVLIVAVAAYFVAAAYLKYTYVPERPPNAVMQLKPPFEKFYGSNFAYVVRAPQLDALSDSSDQPNRSNFLLYENDHPLGPAHSQHTDISKIGKGKFSHWNDEGFIFSSSDNSNPKTTGRRYWVVLPKD